MDLIERAAERLTRANELSLVERAAARQTEQGPPAQSVASMPSPAAPVPALTVVEPLAKESIAAETGDAAAPNAAGGLRLTLDLAKLQIAGFVTPTGSRTRISEEFRVIKRPLLLQAFATGDERIAHGNLIMVTSAKPGEGKTFTAINLAMSLAS
jgi:protein-tyrosine kinase